MSNFADDNFKIEYSKDKLVLFRQMEESLSLITCWLTKSGLKVNESKTELCLFYKKDTTPIKITLNTVGIRITALRLTETFG